MILEIHQNLPGRIQIVLDPTGFRVLAGSLITAARKARP
jgi:hypothetical protein